VGNGKNQTVQPHRKIVRCRFAIVRDLSIEPVTIDTTRQHSAHVTRVPFPPRSATLVRTAVINPFTHFFISLFCLGIYLFIYLFICVNVYMFTRPKFDASNPALNPVA
jgi:hypothetical protein